MRTRLPCRVDCSYPPYTPRTFERGEPASGQRRCGPGPVRHDSQTLNGAPRNQVLVDDLVDIGDLQVAVPDAVRVDDQDRPLVVLLVAAHPRGPNPCQLEALDLIAEPLQDVLGSLSAAVMASDRRADKDVEIPRR